MKTVTVGQALRNSVREVLRKNDVTVKADGWSDGSTTWTFLVETPLCCEGLRRLVWNVFPTTSVEVHEHDDACCCEDDG